MVRASSKGSGGAVKGKRGGGRQRKRKERGLPTMTSACALRGASESATVPALELGSWAQLSSQDSLEQQRRLQGALVRVAALRP